MENNIYKMSFEFLGWFEAFAQYFDISYSLVSKNQNTETALVEIETPKSGLFGPVLCCGRSYALRFLGGEIFVLKQELKPI